MKRVVGIDLGTTHTVVAMDQGGGARVFPVPQLVGAGAVAERPLLPSCLYAPLPGEVTEDPWGDHPWVLGELARRRGAEIPGRMIASAKSWLSHAAVDRLAPILPWGADGDDGPTKISPVEASARVLAHVRRAWDAAFPGSPLPDQDVVLTVPASFDETARELTVRAAELAGLSPRLLEEPQAAFYDTLAQAGPGGLDAALSRGGDGESFVLVVDVGGGTTDLSLIRVKDGDPRALERVAVGHHLLLGGDNMDLALALACERRLVPDGKLDAGRFGQLLAACRTAKEALFAVGGPAEVPVRVLSAGARLVGSTLATSLTREEADAIVLDGFFPPAPQGARPERTRGALVAFGLPYERDVAITRHVAWFLSRHAPRGARLALLLNGGVFRGARVAQRLVASLEAWADRPVTVLPHGDPDLSVARGAVAYGLALRGHGVRIGGGSARGYYVGLGGKSAVSVIPRGAPEGAPHVVERPLALVIGRPVRFDVYASDSAGPHPPGEVVTVGDEETFERLPPLAVAFEGGARQAEIEVRLAGELTPIGTLDLACVEVGGARRFRLAFQLREVDAGASVPPPSIQRRKLDDALALTQRAFAAAEPREVKDLVRELLRLLGERAAWSTELNRALFDVLAPLRGARRKSADHERVFWQLAGFTVRPGFGAPGDEARARLLAPLFQERLSFPEGPRVWQQFWIAGRRAAGGLDEALQAALRDVVDPFLAPPEAGLKRPKKLKPESLDDMLDMAASLERVAAPRRAALGSWIVERTWTDRDPRLWAALGRLGARVPAYASVHHVIAPATVEKWLDHLLREKFEQVPTAAGAAVQMARVTGDRARDVSERVRQEVEKKLRSAGARAEWVRAVRELVPVADVERAAFFGETLPVGLRLM